MHSRFTEEQRRVIAQHNLINPPNPDDHAISYALFVWNGDNPNTARQKAKNGATLPLATPAVLEMCKICAKKKSKLGSPSDVAKLAAPKLAQVFYNMLRIGPRLILRSAFELLRANVITRAISAIVLLSFDTVALARRRISKKQYIINVVLALMLLVGGTAGWYLGNNVMGMIIAENLALSIIAGIVGAGVLGGVLSVAWDKISKIFIKDDTADMLEICNNVFADLVHDYMLNETEASTAAANISIDAQVVRSMYNSGDKAAYARDIITPQLCEIVKQRKVITN